MELIYYWINKKKCIHEQGFCFSPEYNISMRKPEPEKYELEISRNKRNNVFSSDVISNITVLVGDDNGAGKTTLLKELLRLNCYPLENEDEDNGDYQEFVKNKNEKNKNLIILKKENGQLDLYTNIYQKDIRIHGEYINNIYYLSDDSNIASRISRGGTDYCGFTKIYVSNSYFDDANGTGGGGKLNDLIITPARLTFVSNMFFEFICPEKREGNFALYSNWLKQSKNPVEFQQICDLLFYNFLLDTDFIGTYEGFVQTKIRLNINPVFFKIERAKTEENIDKSLMDVVTPFWAILHSKYLTDRAKDDLSYVLKTNFIFEWVLENGQEILNEGDDIEEIYSKIVDNIKKENMSTKNLYFDDAVEEIKQFSKFLEEIPLVKNDVPKNDVAYKTGNETVECSREDISKASEWGKIIAYIAERVKVNKEIFKGKRQYGSFLLRYLYIENLEFSSGERAFQNLMSWIYFLGQLDEYTADGKHHTKKNLLICLDEVDLSLHPAWQRDFIDYLVMFINNCYKENKVQIIMTTHSPLCLSNIPKSNIIYLQKTENGTKVDISEHKETFGANLYEILDDAFYLKYKSMGRFASKYIQKLIKEITECSSLDQENYNIYKQKIEDIGNALIRNKLEEQLLKKLNETEGRTAAVAEIDQKIQQLELRKKKIMEEISDSTKVQE